MRDRQSTSISTFIQPRFRTTLAEHARLVAIDLPGCAAAVPIQLGEPLKSWVLDPDLDKYRRTDPRDIVTAAVDTIAGGITEEIRADYLACYDGNRVVESTRYVRRYPEELPRLAELLPAEYASVILDSITGGDA